MSMYRVSLAAVLALSATLLTFSPEVTQAREERPKVAAASLAEVWKAAGHKPVTGASVLLKTSKGDIEIVLFPKDAPKTVENFTKLVKQGFYDGTSFHRVIPGFVSQGGDPLSKTLPAGHPQIGTGGPGYTIPDEHSNKLRHLPGAVAMAHSAQPNSAGSQFYISHSAIPHLDGGYTIFGHVVKGFEHAVAFPASDAGAAPAKILKATLLGASSTKSKPVGR